MKIIYITQYYYPYEKGGAEVSLRILAENIAKKNNVLIFTIDKCDKKEIINNVTVIRKYIHGLSEFLYDVLWNNKIDKITSIKSRLSMIIAPYHKHFLESLDGVIKEFKPDIVHFNNIIGFPIKKIYEFLSQIEIKSVQTIRDPFLLGITSRGKKIPVWYDYIISVLSKANIIHFPSKTLMRKFGMDITTAKVVIPNTIGKDFNELDWNKIVYRKKESLPRIIGYVGNLGRHKGAHLLCEWYERLYTKFNGNLKLIFVGDGTLRDYIKKKLGKYIKKGSVELLGWVPRDKIDEIMRQFHFLVLPSQWEEMFGRVLVEGFYSGALPIGSSWGAIPEVINDKSLIFDDYNDFEEILVKNFEPKAWRSKMLDLKDHMKNYSLTNHIKMFEKLYFDLINERK